MFNYLYPPDESQHPQLQDYSSDLLTFGNDKLSVVYVGKPNQTIPAV